MSAPGDKPAPASLVGQPVGDTAGGMTGTAVPRQVGAAARRGGPASARVALPAGSAAWRLPTSRHANIGSRCHWCWAVEPPCCPNAFTAWQADFAASARSQMEAVGTDKEATRAAGKDILQEASCGCMKGSGVFALD